MTARNTGTTVFSRISCVTDPIPVARAATERAQHETPAPSFWRRDRSVLVFT
jgi:hypothetical protein